MRRAQVEVFPQGVKEKTLRQLNPQTDDNGILRVNGRLKYAEDLPFDARHSILLPRSHPVTTLIINREHERLGHGTGVGHLLCELRTRFWVPKGRRAIRSIVESCPGCRRRFTAKHVDQITAPLPRSRVTHPLRAFKRIGVDFAGPYLTKQGLGKSKREEVFVLIHLSDIQSCAPRNCLRTRHGLLH